MLRPSSALAATLASLALLAGPIGLAGCGGGKGAATGGEAKPSPAEADPYALLPPAAVSVARFDAHAIFTSDGVGSDVAALADAFVPLGEESGFRAARDVDRVIAASYATSGGDAAAVLVGRFDVDKIAHTTKSKRGGPVVAEAHGSLTAYRSGREAWAPLTPKTLVAGTPEGVNELLDRVAKGTLDRWEPAWMMSTLETPTATFAIVGDFASRPLAAAAVGAVSLPWVHDIRQVRATGTLVPSALDVDVTLTYGNPDEAKNAEGGIRHSVQMLDVLGAVLGGIRVDRFDAKVDTQDLHVAFGLDQQSLRTLLNLAPRMIPTLDP
jgi:hypothetical protein